MDEPAHDLAGLQLLLNTPYRFYQDAAAQRADDLYVRSRAADAVAAAAARVAAEAAAARRAIPPVTREHPFPDAAALAGLAELKALQARLAALETALRGPAALPDGDFSRLRAAPERCRALVALDAALLQAAVAADLEQDTARLEAAIAARAAFSGWNAGR